MKVTMTIEISDGPNDERAHTLPFVEIAHVESVIAPPSDSAEDYASLIEAVLDRMVSNGVHEAKQQLHQVLELAARS